MTRNLTENEKETETETNQFKENADNEIYYFNDYEIVDVDLIDDELVCPQLNSKYEQNNNDDNKIYNFNDYEIVDVDLIDDELVCPQLNSKYNLEYK